MIIATTHKLSPNADLSNGAVAQISSLTMTAGQRNETGLRALVCYPLIIISTALAVTFDWSVRKTQSPGDFLTFRSYAILAVHPHANLHVTQPSLYPPPFLLLTVPISRLPSAVGFIVWVMGALLCLALAARSLKLPRRSIGLGLISAPTLFCALTGQSGILVSAMLLAALGLADTTPLLAGIAAGLLIIKPQFGLLVPVCYISKGRGSKRALVAAASTIAILCVITTICFGPEVWVGKQISNAHSLLTTPWRAKFQVQMITPLMTFRSLQASLFTAIILQIFVSLAAVLCCWRLWRQPGIVLLDRLTPTLCLAMLVTPYAYIYDLPALTMSLAALAITSPGRGLIPFTLSLAFSCLYPVLSVYLFSTGAIFLAAILFLTWPKGMRARRPFGELGVGLLARCPAKVVPWAG